MRLRKKVLLLIGLALFFFCGESVSADGVSFSTKPVMPANQVEGVTGYFDLMVKPADTQVLEVALTNTSKEEVTVEVEVSSATTSDNGSVQYGPSEKQADASLVYNLNELVEYEKEVVLSPKSTLVYPLTLRVPPESFDGLLLGGIEFKQKGKEEAASDQKKSLQIVNKFSYEVAIQMRETSTDVKADMALLAVKAGQVNYRNTVKATLQSPEPTPVTELTVTGKVYQEKGTKVLHERTLSGMTMAPNSNFDFGIPWGKEAFRSGTYRLELTAKAKEGEWAFTKLFKITAEEAKKLNDAAVDMEKTVIWPYVLMGAIVLLLIGIIVYLLLKRTSQSKKSSKKSSRKATTKKKRKKR